MNEMNDHSQRAHALLSASSSARWLACPASAIAAAAYPDTATEFTREGTLAHEVAEAVADWADLNDDIKRVYESLDGYLDLKIREEERGDVTAEMVECARAYADYIQEQTHTDTAVVLLEQRVDFSPWVPEGFGTADCIIIQGNTMDVIDYKYGKGVAVSAEDNPQMKLYALGALNDYGFACDIETVRVHIFQPRLNSVTCDTLPVADLLAWAEKVVKPTAEKAISGKGKYAAGEHCRFCPHAGRCRTLTKTCTEYVETHGMRTAVPVLAAWEIADILAKEPLVSLWLKRVKEQALTTLLDGGEVPGYKCVAGRGSRNWSDNLEVAAMLEAAGYSREDITETTLLSVAKMEKAIGKKKVAELLASQILTTTGAPTIAPMSDKRPVYNRTEEVLKDLNDL